MAALPLSTRTSTDPLLLRSIALRVAASGIWRPFVADPGAGRTHRLLLADDTAEVWLLGWGPGARTGSHDHGDATAAFVVLDGDLVEIRHRREPKISTLAPGQPVVVPPGEVHDVLNPGTDPAWSIHAYGPRLTEMTWYDPAGRDVVRVEPLVPELPAYGGRIAAVLRHPSAD